MAPHFPEKQLERLVMALKDFHRCEEFELELKYSLERFVPPREDFPIPELVLYTLVGLASFEWSGADEKERWSVYAIFRKMLLVFTMAKFGFEVNFTPGMKAELTVALGKLKKAVAIIEECLSDFGDEQLQKGNVTIANRLNYFDHRYRYFRHKANEAYKLAEKDRENERRKQSGESGGIAPPDIEVTLAGMRRDQEGSFCSAAMMDAFFSRLEHELTLIIAFTNFDPANGELLNFLKLEWGPKFKQVFDLAKDKQANTLYGQLVKAKERWRNPLAHGGYEKGWSAVYFHLPGIGPIPKSSSGYRDSLQFDLHPVEPEDHQAARALFDAVDELLRSSHTKDAYEYIHAGFDVAFDEESRTYIKGHLAAGHTKALIDIEDDLRGMDGDMRLEVDDSTRLRFVSQPLTKFWR